MPLAIVRDDITKMQVDAIVNAANNDLRMGGGVCGAIFKAAGERELRLACDAIGRCETGQAVMTQGFHLPARHIIHTAGPIWRGGQVGEAGLLRSCYRNSLLLAKDNGCESVAFPLISTGIYGYPKEEALRVATDAIDEFLSEHEMDVYLVVFDKDSFAVSQELIGEVQAFIDEYYVEEHTHAYRRLTNSERLLESDRMLDSEKMPDSELRFLEHPAMESAQRYDSIAEAPSLEEVVGKLDETFSQILLRLIDAKGLTDVQVYKRANIDRKLFSKIRSNIAYMPSKKTAVAFAIALELSLSETEDLLDRAGYTLSRSQKFDVIIEYFIRNGNYRILEINEALIHFDQPLLGV